MNKKTTGEKIFSVVNAILLIGVAVCSLYPMLYVLFASFSKPMEFMKHTGLLFKPIGFSTLAYEKVFAKPEIFTAYGNTIFYVVVGTIISLIITASFAFVLSNKELYWRRAMIVMIMITMYISGGLIPTYLVVKGLHLVNTRWALVIPGAVSTYNLIVMRSGFESVPVSLREAAEIDGAGPFRVFWKIVFPLSLPTIAVIGLYCAVSHWNDWFNAAIYLRDMDLYPLQLFLRDILITNNQADMLVATESADAMALGEIIKYATIIVSTLPILCVYPYIQKYFTKGVMIGAVKG